MIRDFIAIEDDEDFNSEMSTEIEDGIYDSDIPAEQ